MSPYHSQFNMMHTLELANTHIDGDVSNLVGCKSLEVSRRVVVCVAWCSVVMWGGTRFLGPPFWRQSGCTSILTFYCRCSVITSSISPTQVLNLRNCAVTGVVPIEVASLPGIDVDIEQTTCEMPPPRTASTSPIARDGKSS